VYVESSRTLSRVVSVCAGVRFLSLSRALSLCPSLFLSLIHTHAYTHIHTHMLSRACARSLSLSLVLVLFSLSYSLSRALSFALVFVRVCFLAVRWCSRWLGMVDTGATILAHPAILRWVSGLDSSMARRPFSKTSVVLCVRDVFSPLLCNANPETDTKGVKTIFESHSSVVCTHAHMQVDSHNTGRHKCSSRSSMEVMQVSISKITIRHKCHAQPTLRAHCKCHDQPIIRGHPRLK